MVRLLFVDDEPILLSAMRNRLRRMRDQWSMRFVDSPAAALAELEKEGADVIVSDQNMPGMLGTELLEEVRKRFPQALRILLSGQSEGAGVHEGLRVAHQFLVKPCDLDDLTLAINHLRNLQQSFDNPKMQQVIHAVDKLPTPNAVFQELAAVLADPDVDMKDIAQIMERDPALSLRLMKLANSAFYGTTPVSQVVKAVQRLGLGMVRVAVTYAQVMSVVETKHAASQQLVEAMQQRSLTIGGIACKLLGGEAGQQAYLAGLLHDVGGLVLLSAFPELRETVFAGNPWPHVRALRERELFGFTHTEVGAYLLGTWGQSAALVQAVGNQNAPRPNAGKQLDVTGAVHVAQRLAMEQQSKAGPAVVHAEFDLAYLAACNVTVPALAERAFGREAA